MSKKVSYINLLKDAISEFDTSDTVDVKGPMLDPILSWSGDGELPTNKDAASILERYYFNEDRDEGISPLDEDYENDKGQIGDSKGMENTEGPGGEQQAGTGPAKTIQGDKKEAEKEIAKEDVKIAEQDEEDVEMAKDEDEEELELENTIINKLIAEMEDEDDHKDEDKDKKEVEEGEDFHGGDVKDAMEEDVDVTKEEEKKEDETVKEGKDKEATSSMEDAQGAGTQQAGTGPAEKEIPPRKDKEKEMTKPADVPQADDISDSVQHALDEIEDSILEQDVEAEVPPKPEEEEDEELDVDKEMKEQSAVPGGPSPKKTGEDTEEDVYEEAFKIFKEEIEADIEEIDSDKIRV